MSPNKYWDENGNCRSCGQPPMKHAPKDLKDPCNGVRCCFGTDGKLLPHIRSWLRPIILEAIREFRKTDQNDSLVERVELSKTTLLHQGEIAHINAQWSARVATLEDSLRASHQDWERFNAESLSEQGRIFRRAVEDRDGQIQTLAEEIESNHSAHQKEIAELCKSHEQRFKELSDRHDKELEMAIHSIDRERRMRKDVKPPPTPRKTVAHVSSPTTRVIGPDDIEAHRVNPDKVPLPGLPIHNPRRLQIVDGGKQ